jgi:hypothetical protein
MEVGSKNISIFINGPVLDHVFSAVSDLNYLPEPGIQKIDLQVKRPALHVLVKTMQVRIVFNIFVLWFPIKMFCQ